MGTTVQIKFWYNKNSYQKAGFLVLQYTSKLVFNTTDLDVKCKNRTSKWRQVDSFTFRHSEKLCFEESGFLLSFILILFKIFMTKVITKSEHCNLKFLPNSSARGEGLRNCACRTHFCNSSTGVFFIFPCLCYDYCNWRGLLW